MESPVNPTNRLALRPNVRPARRPESPDLLAEPVGDSSAAGDGEPRRRLADLPGCSSMTVSSLSSLLSLSSSGSAPTRGSSD